MAGHGIGRSRRGLSIRLLLCSLAALVVPPLWGWRSSYFLGISPALLVLWIRIGIKESPRYEHVTAEMLKEGLKKQFDIFAPARRYPREMLIASLIYFFYLFTWLGWSAWMPFYLATERKLGFQTMGTYLSIWMFCAIFAYWFCGWLCDLYGRRWVIPTFTVPAGILLIVMGYCDSPTSLFWVGLAANFLITGSFGTGLGYTAELFPNPDSRYRRRRLFHFRLGGCIAGADGHGMDRDGVLGCSRPAAARVVILFAGAALHLVRTGHDPQGSHRFRRRKSELKPKRTAMQVSSFSLLVPLAFAFFGNYVRSRRGADLARATGDDGGPFCRRGWH